VLVVEVVRQHLGHGGGSCGVAVPDGCGGGSEVRVEEDRGGEETLADFEFGLRPRGMGLVQLSRL
jgi:hypothetical protein